MLQDFRIDAEVSVVEAGDDADMYAYTHDWTMVVRCGLTQLDPGFDCA